MSNCQNCGAEVGPGVRKCAYCGAAVAHAPAVVPPPIAHGVPPHAMHGAHAPMPPAQAMDQKSKIAAGLLGIFLGFLGIHNFYLGFTGKAIAQLLITVLTCGYGSFISWVWGLIEGILILTGSIATDSRGVPLKD